MLSPINTLEEILDFPQSSVGAPMPIVLSDEGNLFLCYYVDDIPAELCSTSIKTDEETVVVVTFELCDTFKFGSPNDEAISGHPLYKNGLRPYSIFKVINSSWIEELEVMNSVHRRHDNKQYDSLNHYIFVFHDSTFECVAKGMSFQVKADSARNIVKLLVDRLN